MGCCKAAVLAVELGDDSCLVKDEENPEEKPLPLILGESAGEGIESGNVEESEETSRMGLTGLLQKSEGEFCLLEVEYFKYSVFDGEMCNGYSIGYWGGMAFASWFVRDSPLRNVEKGCKLCLLY